MVQHLVNQYQVLALGNALIWSLVLIFYRYVMSRGSDAITLMIFGQLGASALLCLFMGVPEYLSYSTDVLSLLVISGLCWALGVFLEILALKYIEATTSGIIAAARYILSFLVGVLVLSENISLSRGFGAALIVAAIVGISEFGKVSFKRGFWLTFIGIFFQVSAYAIDKKLAESITPSAIAVSSFFFPGVVFLLLYPRRVLTIPLEIKISRGLVFLLPAGLALCYLAVITAFTKAEFISVLAIAESALIFTCIFAYLILGEKSDAVRKFLCSLMCALGVVLVCGS